MQGERDKMLERTRIAEDKERISLQVTSKLARVLGRKILCIDVSALTKQGRLLLIACTTTFVVDFLDY